MKYISLVPLVGAFKTPEIFPNGFFPLFLFSPSTISEFFCFFFGSFKGKEFNFRMQRNEEKVSNYELFRSRRMESVKRKCSAQSTSFYEHRKILIPKICSRFFRLIFSTLFRLILLPLPTQKKLDFLLRTA